MYWGGLLGAVALLGIMLAVNPGLWWIAAIVAIPFLRLAGTARRTRAETRHE